MNENIIGQHETSSKIEPDPATKRIKPALVLIALVLFLLSFICLAFFWNITSLALAYPNAQLNGVDLKIDSFDCDGYGRALLWISSIKFLSPDDVTQVESWYQQQGWQRYVIQQYKGDRDGGEIISEPDLQLLDTLHWRSVVIDKMQDSVQIEIRTMTIVCLLGY